MLYLMMKNNVFQIWFAQTLKNKQILKFSAYFVWTGQARAASR